MNFSITKTDFAKVLSRVRGVVGKSTTIPILQNVFVSAREGTLHVVATDLDMKLTATCPISSGMIADDGSFTVSASILSDIVKKASDEEINVSIQESFLIVKCGRSRFKVATMPVTEFPDIPITECEKINLSAADFKLALTRAASAMSREEIRYYLNGVFFNPRTGILVATDGHRLVKQVMPKLSALANAPSVIIPSAAVAELIKLCDGAETIELCVNETKIGATVNGVSFVSKLIDGTFPDYERVIPKAFDRTVTVDHTALTGALARVSVVSNKDAKAIAFSAQQGSMSLAASTTEAEAADEIEAELVGPEFNRYGFNGSYVAEMLKVIPIGEIHFNMTDGTAPITVTHEGAPGFTGVIMPMRV